MEAKVVARGPTHPFDDTLTYFAAIRPDNAERSITLTIPVRFAADYINLSANSNITKSHTRLVEIKTVDTKKDRLNALFRAQTQLDQEMHGLASHERIILRNRTTRVCNCVITRTVRGEWLGGHTCRCDEERGHLLASAETHFMTRLSIILSSAIISGPPSFSTPAGSIAAEAAEKAPVSPVGPVSLAPPGAPAEPSAEAKQSKAQEIKAIKERKEVWLAGTSLNLAAHIAVLLAAVFVDADGGVASPSCRVFKGRPADFGISQVFDAAYCQWSYRTHKGARFADMVPAK